MVLIVISAFLQVAAGVWAFAIGTHEPKNRKKHLAWFVALATASLAITIFAGIENHQMEQEIKSFMDPHPYVESTGMDLDASGNFKARALVRNRGRTPALNVKAKIGLFAVDKFDQHPNFGLNDVPFQGTSQLNPDQTQILSVETGVPPSTMDLLVARQDLIFLVGSIWYDAPGQKQVEVPFCLLRRSDHEWIYRAPRTCAAQ